jgi:hypothetical protein
VRHTDWDELEVPVRLAIEARTGRVHTARTASTGLNSQLAVVLDTDAGVVFIKVLSADHPGAVRQGREAMINAHIRAVAPRLLWHDQAAEWDALAFEFIDGARHTDYRPGSPDLPRVIDAMHQPAAISCPDLPVKQARQRWAAYVDREADLDLLDGDALLHTDFNSLNILLRPDRTWIIDWAWPTRGAAFIHAACFLIWGWRPVTTSARPRHWPPYARAGSMPPSAAIDVWPAPDSTMRSLAITSAVQATSGHRRI